MSFNIKFMGIFVFFCLVFCITSVVSAAGDPVMQPPGNNSLIHPGGMPPQNGGEPMDIINNTQLRDRMLGDLESKGVNTSEIKTAIANGDREKVRNLMRSFRDSFPGPDNNRTLGNGGMSPDFANNTEFQNKMISDLEAAGVNTSEIRTAIADRDYEKVRSLMDLFRDKIPRPNNGTPRDGRMGPGTGEGPGMGPGSQGQPGDMKQQGQESKSQQQPTAVPTSTQSPLSILTILTGIGAAGCAALLLKK